MASSTDADITINEWTWDDSDAIFTSQEPGDLSNEAAIWADYLIKNRYEEDRHLYMLGVTSPDGFGSQQDTVSFVQLASPTLLWIADWTAARFAKMPTIPDPDYVPDGWILIDKHVETGNVTVGSDGKNPYYRISGTYFYGHKKPNSDITKMIAFPRSPWVKDVMDRTVDATKYFEKNLINPVLVNGGAGNNLTDPVVRTPLTGPN